MHKTGLLLRFTRIGEYLHVLLLIFPLVFLISPEDLFSNKTIIIFLANLCLTAFGYMYNDLEDAEDDYHDLDKRKRNPISSGEITRNQSYLSNLLVLSAGLLMLAFISPLVFSLGVVFAFIGVFYSWKPLRLKSRPVLDLVSHVLFLGVLQFLITFTAFRPLALSIIPFLMIIIPFSMMNEIIHELIDFDVDKRTEINNTVQRFERFDASKIFMALSAIIITGLSIIIYTIPLRYKFINLSISLVVVMIAIFRMNARVSDIQRDMRVTRADAFLDS
jgi:4-hydroxybenzoate polyprenyltransferase